MNYPNWLLPPHLSTEIIYIILAIIPALLLLTRLLIISSKLRQTKKQNKELVKANFELQTRLELEEKSKMAQSLFFNTAKDELVLQFENLAHNVLEQKGKRFSQIQNENLSTILSPFQDQLTHFKSEITRMYVDETKDRASLKQEVIQLKELNHKLDKEAKNLVKALKGDKKVQGNWGEFILENILEQSGLRKGHEYTSQKSFKNDENQIYKPDIIIHLPGNRDVVVDSKVSLVAWEKFHSAPDEKNRQLYLKEHCQAVKKHIQTLSSKKYNELRNVHSLDFVLMFLPIETAFLALQEYDQNLINYALDKNILLVSPTSLLTTIRTIENLWRQEKQSKHAQAIASRATILYDKFRQFTEDMEKLGQQLDNSKTTYQSAINRLCKGKGNLVSQAQQLSSLGIKVKKEIPSSIKEESELE